MLEALIRLVFSIWRADRGLRGGSGASELEKSAGRFVDWGCGLIIGLLILVATVVAWFFR